VYATNTQNLVTAHGEESDNWTGKEVRLSVHYYSGLKKNGIVITPIGAAQINDDVPF